MERKCVPIKYYIVILIYTPHFLDDKEYRVKPKPVIQKWRWLVVENCSDNSKYCYITSSHYTCEEAMKILVNKLSVTKIPKTLQEIEGEWE